MHRRLPQPGGDRGTWGNILNAFLSVAHNSDGTPKNIGVIADKYVRPRSGIPKSDLTASVQTSLGKADTAPTVLSALHDVNVSSVSDSQVLVFDSGGSEWIPGTVSSTVIGDATDASKGIIQLAGDLDGSADAPVIAADAVTTTKIADTNVTTAKLANNAVTAAKVANGTLTDTQVASANIDGGAGVPSLRTLGSGASQAAAGDDSRITGAVQKSSNLGDLVSASAARTNLGLGGAATLSVGTTTGTVAAGDDSRVTGAAQKSSNLSDLVSASSARTNLGLGTVATLASDTDGTLAANSDTVVATQKAVKTYIDGLGVGSTLVIDGGSA